VKFPYLPENHGPFGNCIPVRVNQVIKGIEISLKKNFKMADSKKLSFSKSPILKFFLRKFHGLVLGLVELIDAKGIDVTQPILLRDSPAKAQKQAKNAFFAFLGCFCAYVRQRHDPIV
jgi:hypothetical protein